MPNAVTLHPNRREWEGRSRGVMLSRLPERELARGTEHELEHSRSRWVARRTAADHLVEDKKYYSHLGALESQRKPNPADCGCGPHPRRGNPVPPPPRNMGQAYPAGTPAAKAGLHVGQLVQIDDPRHRSPTSDPGRLTSYRGGGKVEIEYVLPSGEYEYVTVPATSVVAVMGRTLSAPTRVSQVHTAPTRQMRTMRAAPTQVSRVHNPKLPHGVGQAVAANPDLARPRGLSPLGNKAYDAIVSFLVKHKLTHTGGSKAFYSPQEWHATGHQYPSGGELVVVYDGGALQQVFAMDHAASDSYKTYEKMRKELAKVGAYTEEGNTWNSGVYAIHDTGAVDDTPPSRKANPTKRPAKAKGKKGKAAAKRKGKKDQSVQPALRPMVKKMLGKACYQPSCFPKPKKPKALAAGRAPRALPPRSE
jgi:hypothetical protein